MRPPLTNPPELPTPADAVEKEYQRIVYRVFDVGWPWAGQANRVRMKCAHDLLTRTADLPDNSPHLRR